MKTMKLILSAILMMMAMCAQAQTIQVMKDGKVVKEYAASEVDSVVVKPYVDRNVYSDAACTQKLFDASKVVTGESSLEGKPSANYSQYIVIPTVGEINMKIPFTVYCLDLDNSLKRKGVEGATFDSGSYYVGGLKGLQCVILAKQ